MEQSMEIAQSTQGLSDVLCMGIPQIGWLHVYVQCMTLKHYHSPVLGAPHADCKLALHVCIDFRK